MNGDVMADNENPEERDRFDKIEDNPFIKTSEQNVSTFSIDADGAAYGYMRKMISKMTRRTPARSELVRQSPHSMRLSLRLKTTSTSR